ncbi:hypothetical protein ACFRFL_30735 [Streptomyces sp. NPDC056708]|uniref:hypothetical protein n=1 Tax=unclassified Streptomyces TaxID=2593676 RepID=UPI0036A4251E
MNGDLAEKDGTGHPDPQERSRSRRQPRRPVVIRPSGRDRHPERQSPNAVRTMPASGMEDDSMPWEAAASVLRQRPRAVHDDE